MPFPSHLSLHAPSKRGSSGFRVGNRVVFFLPRTVGMAGGVSGHVEPCAGIMLLVGAGPVLSIPAVSFESLRTNGWDVEACAELSRSGLALPNQASDPEKGAASSAPTIQIPH
jgi:hypothetical protein